uniref:Uncharacterized protein n=1 Tax=Tanacetum cinerariifolium TaxID=118510 RepID=A0A6L2N8D5_TANCI|nr:hypothetical protein [Tanacetum cinerariifolium]
MKIISSDFRDGTNGWFPLGICGLGVVNNGSPHLVSAVVRLGSSGCGPQNVSVAVGVDDQWVNGGQIEINDGTWHEICGSFRIEKQAGKITSSDFRDGTKGWFHLGICGLGVVKNGSPHLVSALVRLGSSGCGPQNVSVVVGVDDQWVNGGQIEINDGTWHEICGSFRIEKQAGKVMVYIQGPSPFYSTTTSVFHCFIETEDSWTVILIKWDPVKDLKTRSSKDELSSMTEG